MKNYPPWAMEVLKWNVLISITQISDHIPRWKNVTSSLKTKIYLCYIREEKMKNADKKCKMKISKKQKNVFLSHVPKITQPKH